MKSLKALISKSTIHRAHVWKAISLKKSNLQDGDLCMQRDNSIGIYNSRADFDAFNLTRDGITLNGPTLIFYTPGKSRHSDFQHYPIQYYTDDLEDRDYEEEYDVIKIVRGLFNSKDVNDPKKVKEFLENNSNYEKYFN